MTGSIECPLPGPGDEFHHGAPTPDIRGLPKGPKPRNIIDPYCTVLQLGIDWGFWNLFELSVLLLQPNCVRL